MSLQFEIKVDAIAMLRPGPRDDLIEIIEDGAEHRRELAKRHWQTEAINRFAAYLENKYRIDRPLISKRAGAKLGKAYREFAVWAEELGLEHLPAETLTVAIFLCEKAEAGAKSSEIKALADGISYAHRRVFYADPTIDPTVKAVIQRKLKPESN